MGVILGGLDASTGLATNDVDGIRSYKDACWDTKHLIPKVEQDFPVYGAPMVYIDEK